MSSVGAYFWTRLRSPVFIHYNVSGVPKKARGTKTEEGYFMKVAFVGLAQSGKTTLFKSLVGEAGSEKQAGVHGIRIGNVKVPDRRLDRLAEIFRPPKVVHANIDVVDTAGARIDRPGTGLTAEMIAEIRTADALVSVVRVFENPSVVHPAGTIDPLRDMKNIEAELGLTDMIQIEKRLQRLEKEHSAGLENDILVRAKRILDSEKPLRLMELNEVESKLLAGFCFLSQKPILTVLNVAEEAIGMPLGEDLTGFAERSGGSIMGYCAELEAELSELEDSEQEAFHAELGLKGSGRERLIRKIYELLSVISFFTIGDTEIRAWAVPENTRAIDAAGKVHSDMQRGFIRAEVIGFDEFDTIGSLQTARESGRLRLEGKEYEVRDGDLIKFRFHV